MQSIAKFAMRSPLHAIGVSMLAASLPLLSWLSAAVVALVVLSQGIKAGATVFVWTLIPLGIGLHYTSDPTSIFLVASVFLLALALRHRFSWEHVLIFAFFITLTGAFLYYNIASTVFQQLINIYNQVLVGTDGIPNIENKDLVKIMISGYSVMLYFFSIAVLSLARWCQSCLYNPSGFGSEFRSLRLSPYVSLAAVLAVLGYSVNESVVVFDRVRENFRRMRKDSVEKVINNAITRTMSRTIMTHLSTQTVVISMLIFGGEILNNFALALTIGILFGIYSSIMVGCPLAMWLGTNQSNLAITQPENKNNEIPNS